MPKKVRIKCERCNGTGEIPARHHNKLHELNQTQSCWACGCPTEEECPNCNGNGVIEGELIDAPIHHTPKGACILGGTS